MCVAIKDFVVSTHVATITLLTSVILPYHIERDSNIANFSKSLYKIPYSFFFVFVVVLIPDLAKLACEQRFF